ncbi:MAG: ATP-binding cassette domain-containing protein [Aquincola sp.]|nr:ATP-binding cassette domain-containing protein [Aquincola sp.]MDH4290911.1 ATP-binding cassette domain-containing protein [Aquincola sp.]MDH5329671.1 ATP-binding cassette domain-containing protein [Aquincola sp.]
MLELADVTIRVHGRTLVDRLSARVAPGDVLAVTGASGTGKSSLLAWIAGTLEAPFEASGGLVLDGRDLTSLPIQQRHIGLLFQDDLLFPHMSVHDNLLFALPARVASDGRSTTATRAQRLAAADEALTGAGLGGFGPRLPASLSGGQRSRVSLLRALLAQPQALLLDEPFSKLDAALRAQMRAFTFSTLRGRRVPAVLVTHDQADIPHGAQVVSLDA